MTAELIERAKTIATQRRDDAKNATPGPWEAKRQVGEDLHWGSMYFTEVDAPSRNLFAVAGMPLADAQHIANHDPAAMVPLWTWVLGTLKGWQEYQHGNNSPASEKRAAATNARSSLAYTLARVIVGDQP